MEDWRQYYSDRILTAQEAVQHIKSGDTVVVTHAAGEPVSLVQAMVDNKEAYRDVEIIHCVSMGKCEYCRPENSKYFRHNAWFAGGNSAQAIADGRADFSPCYLSQMPWMLEYALPHVDVFLAHVSPPDKHGMCSLGISVDYGKKALEQAKIVIAQVNKNMPRTMGNCFVPVTDIDYFVPCDEPIIELGRPNLTDVERNIGANCASLIEDGSTLQLGIGSLPDAVLLFLKEKKDLGIHSEMISDGVMELMKAGVITNRKKTLNPGKSVVTFAMGTRALYDFLDDNPQFQMMPAEYVNDSFVIAQNDKMVSINSCVEIDFSGQLASETVGKRQISGTGGQVDFFRGAVRSKGGKAIVAIASTAQKGKVSKIVPYLSEGTVVTTGRCDVDYVVTEYGIAHLRGHTHCDRAKSLIKIAHPAFREQLACAWEEIFHMPLDRAEIGL